MQDYDDTKNTGTTVSVSSVVLGKKYDISGDLVYIPMTKNKQEKTGISVLHGRLTRPIVQINMNDGFICCSFGSKFLINENLVIRTLSWINYDVTALDST